MHYPVGQTPTVFVDHEALQNLYDRCNREGARVALVGFNEYAKHLINLSEGKVIGVYDPDPLMQGVRFRGVPVVSLDTPLNTNLILVVDYKLLYEYLGQVVSVHRGVEYYYPPRLHYKDTTEIKFLEQEELYRSLRASAADAPLSMMGDEKIWFVLELLRMALRNPGDIVEMGVYQGGSTWYMAKLLRALGETRAIHMMDLFEEHMMHPNATMCTDEIARRHAFYPPAHLMVGLVDDERLLSQIRGKPLCFAHYDLGFHLGALTFLWEHLQPGAPLVLDNYGHLAGEPWLYDQFFAERGTRVVRLPWSEQGLVFRTHDAPAPAPAPDPAPASTLSRLGQSLFGRG